MGVRGGKAGKRRVRSAGLGAVRTGREESSAFHCVLFGDLWLKRASAERVFEWLPVRGKIFLKTGERNNPATVYSEVLKLSLA